MKICDGCYGIYEDNVMLECRCPDESQLDGYVHEWLCPYCNDGGSYCKSCGEFCAGISSFEFGPYAGYCDNCADEIQAMERDDEENFNEWGESDF